MKKIILLGGFCGLLALTACNKDNDYYETRPFNAAALNLITNLNDGATAISQGAYTFSLTFTNSGQNGVIAAYNVVLNEDAPTNFVTIDQPYVTDNYFAYFQNVQSSDIALKNANFLLTPYYYQPGLFANDLQGISINFPKYGDVVVANYTVGNNYLVRTFQPETFYYGKTSTKYPYMGQMSSYQTEDIYYHLSLDTKENKATMYIYNAKFSDSPEPRKKMIVLNDLSVDYSANGITVSGADIIPLVGEGNSTTPNEDFIFKTITFETTNNILTECQINFIVEAHMTVNGTSVSYDYEGNFSGAYVFESIK